MFSLQAIVSGMDRWQDYLDTVADPAVSAQTMARIGLFARVKIQERTERGVDFKGKLFAAYAERTVKSRTARGRQTDHVDLHDFGTMAGAFSVTAGPGLAKLFFVPPEGEKAARHILGDPLRNLPQRDFMYPAEDDIALMHQMLADALKD